MAQRKRRGFTIVELVIVIAVIAILAGVLIPTFVSVIKKANEARDISLITSLNKSVSAGSVTSKPETMHDALEIVKADGFDVEKIKATAADNEILWDKTNNCFVYLKGGKVTYVPDSYPNGEQSGVELWKIIAKDAEVSPEYSNYLEDGYQATGLISVQTGIDVGNNAGLSISYTGSKTQSVVIRTDGGALTVNASTDTVHHYGYVEELSVEAVSASDCYHEHGFVGKLTNFASGKLVAAQTAQFHQTKDEVQGVLASGVTLDDLGGAFGNVHYFDNEGVCVVGDCKATSPEHVHKLDDGIVTKNSTCGAEGEIEHTCATCGAKVTEVIPASGQHTWGEDDKCVDCGQVKSGEDEDTAISVGSFVALKNIIDNINDTTEKEVKFSLSENLATSKTSIIEQPRNTGITIDLNGHTLVLYNSKLEDSVYTAGLIISGRFEIIDSSSDGSGKIVASTNSDNVEEGGLITVEKDHGGGTPNTELILTSGTIDATASNGCAIMLRHGGRLTINGGTVKANGYAIGGSTSDEYYKSQLVITGGEITSLESYAIYHPQYFQTDSKNTSSNGRFEISGGKVIGKLGIIKMGGAEPTTASSCTDLYLLIAGGELISHSDHIVYIDAVCNKGDTQQIKVTGGKFENATMGYFCKVEKTEKTKGTVRPTYLSGGTYKNISTTSFMFNTTTSKVFAKATYSTGYKYNDNTNGTWSVIAK